jgi:hypothetical protein
LSLELRLQYYLDNLATEQAAVHFIEKANLRPVTGTFDGRRMTVHLARYNGDRVH